MQGAASVALLLMGTLGSDVSALAQAAAPQTAGGTQTNPTAPATPQAQQVDTTGRPDIPQAPEPAHPGPLYLRKSGKDYSNLKAYSFKHPLGPYTSTDYDAPRLSNTPKLADLLRNGQLYLSLSDAVLLTLENNYDIEIARVNLDIADTDILRAKAGSTLRGVSSGVVTNTLGGTSSTVTGGGGPGGTTTSSGGSGTGASGLVLSTNGGGPTPLNRDGLLTGTIQYEDATTPGGSSLGGGTSSTSTSTGTGTGTGTTTGTGSTGTGTTSTGTSNLFNANPTETTTGTYNFNYLQGFSTGTQLQVSFTNSRVSSSSTLTSYRPNFNSAFKATVTQQLLQGFGPGIQNRFVVQAKNNRRIADSAFRQQLISTVTQIESIYWSLVSAYEDVQAKTRALEQSTKLASDNRRQLEIGTLAPLDIVNSDQAVSTDRQSLTTSQSNLEYQQLLMKQAIVRDLNDPVLANAPVIPTDRVSLERTPEEDMPVEDLVKQAYINNPLVEQGLLTLDNNKITIKAEKNGLLPILNAYAFYGGTGIAGNPNPTSTICTSNPTLANCGLTNVGGYGTAFQNGFNNSAPDKGVGATLSIPIRNRPAQADQARSQMEYRQAQMRLQQLYTQLRIQVINGQFALTNDRASVVAAQATRDYQAQALDAEQKRFRLGASTTANVLQQERNLATAENTLITATAVYARDRGGLLSILANTLDRYGISLVQAAAGTMTTAPVVPGLTAPQAPAAPRPLTSTPAPLPPDTTRPAPGAVTPR
ncbi:TolC family protein [Terriglobus roseus]|uniref:Outer membrane protein TolC n=1 Tax=Terriglobus roseus TaxID=392734 RepID=A0A1H4TG03_9BACT|nr:TolC family protein [Terriglobus roseus]SEC55372.1 Outer membrane protein TolC [Terriglobus roseus]